MKDEPLLAIVPSADGLSGPVPGPSSPFRPSRDVERIGETAVGQRGSADSERILQEASSDANEACIRQVAIDYLDIFVPQSGGRITGPATLDSTSPPFALPLAGNFFRVHVPYFYPGNNLVLSFDTFRVQKNSLSASFLFATCCVTPEFAASEMQAVDRVAARVRQYAG